MGLGKSAQAVRACDLVAAQRILVVCPAAVRVNWEREFFRFSPMDRTVEVVESAKKFRADTHVTVVSFEGATTLAAKLQAIKWDVLIIDEAHFLKERSTKRTKAIYGYRKNQGIMGSASFVWRLSGTPAPNDASELWTHLKSAGVIDTPYWDFVFQFCAGFEGNFGYNITGHKNTEALRGLLGRLMLRRKKEQVMTELPPITFHEFTVERSDVELDPWFYEQWRPIGVPAFLESLKEQDRMFKFALDAISEKSKHIVEDKVALLESMAGGLITLRRYIGMAKVPKIAEIIDAELASGAIDKIVVFAVHQSVIESLRVRLIKHNPVTLYGGTPAPKRQKNIDKFQKDPKCKVFIGNVQAAGTGITLTAAHEVAFVECSYRPDENAQAAMRCHRIGQTKPVRVRVFNCAKSVDEQVQAILFRKMKELTKIID